MNRIIISFYLLLLCFSPAAFAQNYLKHVVSRGETITQIATKYKVTPYDIYKLNPDSQAGIKENDVVLIPIAGTSVKTVAETAKQKTTAATVTTHVVKPKQSLYSIARGYNVSVADLRVLNEETLKEGLKTGQLIKIPASGTVTETKGPEVKAPVKATASKPSVTKSDNEIYHVVEPKETKFGIAKKYGITVSELEQRNPTIVSSLPVGYKLTISGKARQEVKSELLEKPKFGKNEVITQENTQAEAIKKERFSNFANYEVKPKETLYSLSQMFDIAQDELLTLNPTLKEGVKVGMILKVPAKGSTVMPSSPSYRDSKFADLTKSIKNQQKKKLVLMLPFNAAKIQGDMLKTIAIRLKKDAFLNMTLDFYSGALMAIDSAKTLGLNIEVKIFDSEESKVSSNVAGIVEKNNLLSADAIIGPFYQQYIEKVAELVGNNSVPVISPLSKDSGKPLANLYQAMPPSEFTKGAMFDFMMAKKGNIIVVSDPKRLSNKEFISKNYASAKFVAITETGAVDTENLKSLFVKDRVNYVVMDSEKTGMILSTTNVLLNQLAGFQIQLVIIEPNETFDFDEISMKRLTTLKLLYPSMTRENHSLEADYFENKYKQKNKIFPSQFAVRGFDVTFDTMLRLSQEKSFETSVNEDKTEQVESKFEYVKKSAGGYLNKGVYILEYQEDLSVKKVN